VAWRVVAASQTRHGRHRPSPIGRPPGGTGKRVVTWSLVRSVKRRRDPRRRVVRYASEAFVTKQLPFFSGSNGATVNCGRKRPGHRVRSWSGQRGDLAGPWNGIVSSRLATVSNASLRTGAASVGRGVGCRAPPPPLVSGEERDGVLLLLVVVAPAAGSLGRPPARRPRS
jgi:hypothetical protein